MPKQDHVSLEELDIKYGYSVTPGSTLLFTREENEFREDFRAFLHREILPKTEDFYRHPSWPLNLKLCRAIPAKYVLKWLSPEIGGEGKIAYNAIYREELAAVSYSMAQTTMIGYSLIGVLPFLTKKQLKEWLLPTITLGKYGSVGITEPTGGSDAWGGMQTRATLEGDEWVINGQKRFITNGSKADYILLFAITNPDVRPQDGMSAFIVPTDTQGFERVKDYGLMGRPGTVLSWLRFNDCRIPKDCLVGEVNKGSDILQYRMDVVRAGTVFNNLGAARSAFEIAAKYAAERMQFERPLRAFEGVNFKIADMYARLEACRLMGLRAFRMIEAGLKATKEATAAKFFAAEACFQVANDALQVLGGIGYTTDYPVERIFRDLRVAPISEGGTEVMKVLTQREIYREMGY